MQNLYHDKNLAYYENSNLKMEWNGQNFGVFNTHEHSFNTHEYYFNMVWVLNSHLMF